MVKFTIFPTSKKPSQDLEKYKEISYRMLKSGKTEREVAAYLKSQGLSYEEIDKVLNSVIKSSISSSVHSSSLPAGSVSALSTSSAVLPSNTHYTPPREIETAGKVSTIDEEVLSSFLEKIVAEMESIVDAVLDKKYGDIQDNLKSIAKIKEEVENIDKKIEDHISDFTFKINERLEKIEKEITHLREKIEEMEPKIKALESAFKDTVPNLIDDLRKVEEMIAKKEDESSQHAVFSLKNIKDTKEKKEDNAPQQEDALPSNWKLDDLIN